MTDRAPASRTLAIILIALGVLAILVPAIPGLVVVIWVGALLVLAGLAELLYAKGGEGQSKLGAIVTLLFGGLLIVSPEFGSGILAILLAVYFFATGANLATLGWRRKPRDDWMPIFVTGLLCILLGLAFIADWPVSGAWAIGIFIGIRLLMGGIAILKRASAGPTR
jgi:uncharacterized membrane protein HdeD (DUF308 family)